MFNPSNARKRQQPWLIRMDHRMRTASFALVFTGAWLHGVDKDYGWATWLLCIVALLLYPHLQYLRAVFSDDPLAVEMQGLLYDSVLLGMVVAALGFPLWIGVSAMLGTMVNNAANKGWRGVGQTFVALPAGALLWVAPAGFQWSPETAWPTTLFCIIGLTGYIATMANVAYARNNQLRQARTRLLEREKEILEANATLTSGLREIDNLHMKMREQTNRDALTSLYNRHYLDTTFTQEVDRCIGDGTPVCLLMIDIDNFKDVNDTFGHAAGDEVLTFLGMTIRNMTRVEDLACRYGGEEFLLLISNLGAAKALERAEELRSTFHNARYPFSSAPLQFTLSIGIAAFPEHGADAAALLKNADQALYEAKRTGRDRVFVWSAECGERRHG